MKFLLKFCIVLLLGAFLGAPFLNQYYVKYDFIILPKNIYLKKNPFIRSINGLRVNYIQGKVFALKSGEAVQLKVQDQLEVGDTVYVRDNSWLILEFAFGSRVKVNANSLVKIAELKKDLDQFDYSKVNTFILKSGSLYIDHHGYNKDLSLRIKAKHTAMGIRGTNFIAAIGDHDLALRVAVENGLVQLENKNNEALAVAAGEGAIASFKGKFSEAKAHRWVSQINWELEHASFEKPQEYEQNLENKLKELAAKKKADLDAVKNFKPSADAITNDNFADKLNQTTDQNTVPDPVVDVNNPSPKLNDDETEIESISVDLNFTRFSRSLPKINKSILDKFIKSGLVPDDLKIAKETIFEAEKLMERRAQQLEKIEED